MREMLLSFDPAKEPGPTRFRGRPKRALAAREERRGTPGSVISIENPVTARLVEIQKTIDAKNYSQAATDLKLTSGEKPRPKPGFITTWVGSPALLRKGSRTPSNRGPNCLEAKTAFENVLNIRQQKTSTTHLFLFHTWLSRRFTSFTTRKNTRPRSTTLRSRSATYKAEHSSEAMAAKQRLLKQQ